MTVILVRRAPGSRAVELAAATEDCLGVKFSRRDGVDGRAAEQAQVDECTGHRRCEGHTSLFGRWMIGGRRLAGWRFAGCVAERSAMLSARGNVLIWSRGAAPLLRVVKQMICMRIQGPVVTSASEPDPDLLDEGFTPIEVDLGSWTVRLTGVTSSEEAIARVEQHLPGGKHGRAQLLPSRHGIL